MLIAGVGRSTQTDAFAAGHTAALEALAQCGGKHPSCVLVAAGFQYANHTKILQGVMSATGDVPLIGGTAAGEISSTGISERSVVVMVLHSPEMGAAVGIGTGLAKDSRGAGRRATEAALRDISGADAKLLLLIYAGWIGSVPDIVAGAQEVLGRAVPIVGGAASAGGTADYRPISMQFVGERVLSGSVVALLLTGNLRVVTRMVNGARLLAPPLRVTRAEGNKIVELNDRSAYDVFSQVTAPAGQLASAITHPLAILEPSGFTLRTVTSADQDKGELYLVYPEQEQADVQFTTVSAESIIAAHDVGMRSALADLQGRPPRALICFDCSAQKWVLGRQAGQEVRAMQQHIPDVPLIGFYSSGEIGVASTVDDGCGVSKFSHFMTSSALLAEL